MTETDYAPLARRWGAELAQNRLRYPDETVVRFVARHRPPVGRGPARALDVGFGSGRHLRLLAEAGWTAYGIELMEEAVTTAEVELADLPIGDLRVAALEDRPFPAGSFGAVVCWGVAPLCSPADLHHDLAACHDLLEPGGHLLINFRTPDNWFAALGRSVAPHTVELDERAGSYAGITYSFVDEPTATSLLEGAGFVVDDIERIDLWRNRAREQHSWLAYDVRRVP